MTKIDLHKRTTHKYASGWSHLDESEHIGTARCLGQKTTKQDGWTKTSLGLFLVSSKHDSEEVKQALRDSLSHHCRCEHDCCGHWQTDVYKVRHLGKGLYAARLSSYVNC